MWADANFRPQVLRSTEYDPGPMPRADWQVVPGEGRGSVLSDQWRLVAVQPAMIEGQGIIL
jgi:hypothetical protein